uniref:glycosyltransferase family 2 protein n=1 Tax=Agathobacter sp. TaxID=2021311 RepID=UPI0040578271
MKEPLVSIIIPIYNTSKHLSRCLQSLENQTYQNIEILLVDDGSTDGSGAMADKFACVDSRFKVFHLANGGVSNARNHGLKYFQGEYVTFVDSDDFVDIRYIERLYYAIIKCNVLLSRCLPYDSRDEEIQEYYAAETSEPIKIKIKKEFDYSKKYAYGPTWGALLHRSLVKDIFFDTSIYVGEDALFFASVLLKCEEMSFLREQLYVYVIYAESASHGVYDEKKKTNIIAWQNIIRLFEKFPDRFQSRLRAKYCTVCLTALKDMMRTNYSDKKWNDFLLKGARSTLADMLRSKYALPAKVSAFLYCLMPYFYGRLHNKIRK